MTRSLGIAMAGALALLLAGGAVAAYEPGAEIVSVDNARLEQGDGAVLALTATPDGRYVVFRTRASNFFADDDPDPAGRRRVGGIFRYDRLTGALALVADGDETDAEDGSTLVRGAQNPSVSEDGRYVAFSTGQRLVVADGNDNIDVYVRDMSVPLASDRASTGAYVLVSAKDGGDVPASYAAPAGAPAPLPGQRNAGAELWPGTSISADGHYVVFRTAEQDSDLPDRSSPTVPAGQVLIRDIPDQRTYLQTVTTHTQGATAFGEPAGGATGPLTISSDGSTIAWVGTNAPAQTRFVDGEALDSNVRYYLLRRWREGAGTRRITGIADPTDPACGPGGKVSTDTVNAQAPCDGPLTDTEGGFAGQLPQPPALSADGTKVAYLATAGRRPLQTANNAGLDLFYTDLAANPSLKATTVEITRDGQSSDRRATAPLDTVTMTGDGRLLAVTTARSLFTLPILKPVGTFRQNADVRELYVVDLVDRTIERVVRGAGGGDADGPIVGAARLSDGGGLAIFASDASNLFFGDANGATDAFVTPRTPTRGASPPPAGTNSPPSEFDIGTVEGPAERRIGLRVAPRRDGRLRVKVRVPEAGSLLAVARRLGPAVKGQKARRRVGAIVARSTFAAAKKGTAGTTLTLLARHRRKLRPGGRIPVRIVVTFSPPPPATPLSARADSRLTRTKKPPR